MDFPSGWISPEGKFRRLKGDFAGEGHADAIIEWKVFKPFLPDDYKTMDYEDLAGAMEETAGRIGAAGWIAAGRANTAAFTVNEKILKNRRHPAVKAMQEMVEKYVTDPTFEIHIDNGKGKFKVVNADTEAFIKHGVVRPMRGAASLRAVLSHVALSDRALHDSGNLKTYIQRKDLDKVLDLADCWYELPFADKGREAIKMAIDMGRTAKEHTIYRVMLNNYFIYFIGNEDSIIRKLDTVPDEKDTSKQAEDTSQTTDTSPNMSDQSSPKMSDSAAMVMAGAQTITLYRGFNLLPEHDEPELILDPLYHGQGIFGEGTYYSSKLEIAKTYGQDIFKVKFAFKNLLTLTQRNSAGFEDAGVTDTLIVDEDLQEQLRLATPEIPAHKLARYAFEAGFDGIHLASQQTDGGEQLVIPVGAKPKIINKAILDS